MLEPTVNFKSLNKGMLVEFECNEYFDKNTNENKGFRAFKIKVI